MSKFKQRSFVENIRVNHQTKFNYETGSSLQLLLTLVCFTMPLVTGADLPNRGHGFTYEI